MIHWEKHPSPVTKARTTGEIASIDLWKVSWLSTNFTLYDVILIPRKRNFDIELDTLMLTTSRFGNDAKLFDSSFWGCWHEIFCFLFPEFAWAKWTKTRQKKRNVTYVNCTLKSNQLHRPHGLIISVPRCKYPWRGLGDGWECTIRPVVVIEMVLSGGLLHDRIGRFFRFEGTV